MVVAKYHYVQGLPDFNLVYLQKNWSWRPKSAKF